MYLVIMNCSRYAPVSNTVQSFIDLVSCYHYLKLASVIDPIARTEPQPRGFTR